MERISRKPELFMRGLLMLGTPMQCTTWDVMYQHGTGVDKDFEKSRIFYERAADAGDTDGVCKLAWMP